jgi:hypothetical protein
MEKTNLLRFLALATLIIILAVANASAGQNFLGGLHFNVGFPHGDFKTQLGRNAYGAGGQFFFFPRNFPLAIGVEGGWMNYGSESRREPFSTTIPDVTVDVNTSNNLVQGFLIGRIQLPKGPIRPYGDYLIGFNYLFTETKISNSNNSSQEVASSTNQDCTVFAHGFGGGLMIPVYKSPASKPKPFEVLIDAGLRYIYGGFADYLKKGSIRREDGTVIYDLTHSKTDMLRLHIGAAIRF